MCFLYLITGLLIPTLSKIMEMHNLVFQEQVQVPGCSCEYKATHGVWGSRLEQYRSKLKQLQIHQ
jgi:hypothetical protein